jgi:fatty-acid desaturase
MNSIVFGLLHGGALAALFMFNWRACAIAFFLYWMSAGLGINMGYHRLHTHRPYQVPLALKYFFAVCGTLTLQGGPIFWVATHRIHDQKSDQPGSRTGQRISESRCAIIDTHNLQLFFGICQRREVAGPLSPITRE